jgi:hypothetical protein
MLGNPIDLVNCLVGVTGLKARSHLALANGFAAAALPGPAATLHGTECRLSTCKPAVLFERQLRPKLLRALRLVGTLADRPDYPVWLA